MSIWNKNMAMMLAIVAAFATSALADDLFEFRYRADSGKEPSEAAQSPLTRSSTGTSAVKEGSLHTVDADANSDGRYYFLPPQIARIDSTSDIELAVEVGVPHSVGSRTATAVELRIQGDAMKLGPFTKGGHGEGYQDILFEDRQIAIGWMSDGKDHSRDEVLLIDASRPGDEGIVGRLKLPIDQPRKYHLAVRRGQPGAKDDVVELSVDAPGTKPISLPLNEFVTRSDSAGFSLIFGHPAGPGVAEADWKSLDLRVIPRELATKPAAAADSVHSIRGKRQLFLDDLLIADQKNLIREQGQPIKAKNNPVLKREKPWEDSRCELYGSAIWNPEHDRLEMFYSAMHRPYDTKLALALSSDLGQSWTRPALDIFPWEGKPSNIVYPGRYWTHGPCVLFDPHDKDPARRYKLFLTAAPLDPAKVDQGPKGIDAAFSPDGIHWTPSKSNPVIAGFNSDTGNSVIWDEERQLYRAYVRMRCNVGRSVAVTESADFINWTEPRTIYIPTAGDAKRKWEFYGLSVTPYEGMFVGLVWIFPNVPSSSDPNSDAPVTWPELVISRDGDHWQRPFFSEAFLPLGPKGSFDHRQIRPASSCTILPEGNLALMYSGSPDPHVSGHKWDIGMATIRQDGFVNLKATDKEGELTTAPLEFDAGQLFVNVEVEKGGYMKAELLDSSGKAVPGYELAQCQPIEGDSTRAAVNWKSKNSLAASPAAGSRLRFVLKDAKLYSYQVAEK